MTRLQEIRETISRFEQRYARLQYDKEVLERAWSPKVKASIPGIKQEMDSVLTAMREAEAEEHQLTWPRLRTSR